MSSWRRSRPRSASCSMSCAGSCRDHPRRCSDYRHQFDRDGPSDRDPEPVAVAAKLHDAMMRPQENAAGRGNGCMHDIASFRYRRRGYIASTGAKDMTRFLRAGLVGALLMGAIGPAAAQPQNYPARTITFVVPFAPGGLTDVPARLLAAMMQERIGQNIVIDNKPGGSGVVGGSF